MTSDSLFHIVLAQINVIFGKPEENFEHITRKLNGITFNQENNLIVLPELFATGYDLQAIKSNSQSLNESKIVGFLKKIAKNKNSFVYASVPELFENKVFNTGVLINPSGDILSFYRKIHLFKPLKEDLAFLPGEKVITTNSIFGQVGLSICYDLRFAELYVNQRNEGAKIFLICAEWPITRIQHWKTLVQARAIEHQTLMIALNRVGEDPTGIYGGNSLIVAPDGEILIQADGKETILEYNLDFQEKINIPFLFNIKTERRLS